MEHFMLAGGKAYEDQTKDAIGAHGDGPVAGVNCVYEVRHGATKAFAAW